MMGKNWVSPKLGEVALTRLGLRPPLAGNDLTLAEVLDEPTLPASAARTRIQKPLQPVQDEVQSELEVGALVVAEL